MPSKPLKISLCAIVVGVVLSACQADVLVSTELDASGGGRFTLAVSLDREAHSGLANTPAGADGSGLSTLVGMFERLRARGWEMTSTEPDGGLHLSATRAFADSRAFDALLDDLRAPDQQPSALGSPQLALDFATKRSFFRTRSTFSGRFDTAPQNPELRETLRSLQNFVNFEVRAQLPGALRVEDTAGTVVGDKVVWRPELGTTLRFAAASSALRVGPVLLAILPALLLLCVLAWLLLGKRPQPQPLAIIPDETPASTTAAADGASTTIVLEPEPVEQLLAIERDPVES